MTASMSPSVRRQVYELTAVDLEAYPAWEFALDEEGVDGQDEATVRPYLNTPIEPTEGMLVVRAKFTLADGTVAIGFMTPPQSVSSDIRDHQPSIITNGRQVALYSGMFPLSESEVVQRLDALGKSASEAFPLEYETDVEIVSGPTKCVVRGFSFLHGGLSAGVIETV